ncbi:hypothetical protein [Actibacterium sp. MT2.3-13A]|uniref:hypothetical protein n=1 Tax=Actibacterium sp. MT2.3-13A TaxID=2828332 RepID=UPI001BA89B28|nr:hypothetical protein [Actibacterium sp. MT2.3-13A]
MPDDTGAATELRFSHGCPLAGELRTTVNLLPEGDAFPTCSLSPGRDDQSLGGSAGILGVPRRSSRSAR